MEKYGINETEQSFETERVHLVLPTIRKSLSNIQKNTDKQAHQLKNIITHHKINNLVKTYVNKLKNNLLSSKPVRFQVRNKTHEDDERRNFKAKGTHFSQGFLGIILILDILFTLITLFLSSFQALLEDFRDNVSSSTTVLVLKVISIVIFTIRLLVLIFSIQYQTEKNYEYIKDIVAKETFNGNIIWRLFSLVMVILSIAFSNDTIIGVIFIISSILKLLTFGKDISLLELIFINSSKRFYIWNLTKVLIFNLIFAHIIAIILLAIRFINTERNWVDSKLLSTGLIEPNLPWLELYFFSYYWACTIMMTVGFGDISPVQYRQVIVVALIEIFSVLILAYNINFVGNIVNALKEPQDKLDRKLGVIYRMNKKNPISKQLEGKVRNYLIYQNQLEDSFEYDELNQIIDQLPDQLKNQYYHQANEIIFENLPFFWHLQAKTLLGISRALTGKIYYPSQYLLKMKKDPINEVIIVRQGTVGFQYWKPQSKLNGVIVQSIKVDSPSKPFEITNFLNRFFEIKYNIVAESYSYALAIPKQQLVNILRESNLDFYYYASVIDKHEKDTKFYSYTLCEYCSTEKNEQFHTKFNCPKLHYTQEKSKVVLKYLYSNNRNKEARKIYRRENKAHSYSFRKNLFKLIENGNSLSQVRKENQHIFGDIDLAYNYPNYFKHSNIDLVEKVYNQRKSILSRNEVTNQLRGLREASRANIMFE